MKLQRLISGFLQNAEAKPIHMFFCFLAHECWWDRTLGMEYLFWKHLGGRPSVILIHSHRTPPSTYVLTYTYIQPALKKFLNIVRKWNQPFFHSQWSVQTPPPPPCLTRRAGCLPKKATGLRIWQQWCIRLVYWGYGIVQKLCIIYTWLQCIYNH